MLVALGRIAGVGGCVVFGFYWLLLCWVCYVYVWCCFCYCNLDTTFVVLWLCGKPCFVGACLLMIVADWFMVVLLDDWLV